MKEERELDLMKRLYSVATRIANCLDSRFPCRADYNWSNELYAIVKQLEEEYGYERFYPKEGGIVIGGRVHKVDWRKRELGKK